jgi:hypothetical protein
MRRILLCALLAAALPACTTTTVPVVKEAQKCVPAAALLEPCGEPADVRAGITYGELIDASRGDREKLKACALRQRSLAAALTDCNGSIDKYNADIREINARNAKQ